MGVPRLALWIKNKFPGCVAVITTPGEYQTNYLYIDGPSIDHAAAQKINNYGAYARKMDPFASLPQVEKDKKTYEEAWSMYVRVSEIVTPNYCIFIGIDGTAPVAKQTQQRGRRFDAASKRTDGFDSNVLTPGTNFRLEMTKYFHQSIRQKITTTPSWQTKDFKVIFSPSSVPGEGEHKCIDYIRSLPSYVRSTTSHCIYGPDGDLIMLAIAAPVDNIFLLRDSIGVLDVYEYLDIGEVKEKLPQVLYGEETKRDKLDCHRDFILAGFFVGNDFLPMIKMFFVLEEGLETTLDIMREMSKKGIYITKNGKINKDGFVKLIEKLAEREQDLLIKNSKVNVTDPKFIDHTLIDNIKDGKLQGSYVQAYYEKAGVIDEVDLIRMCEDYIRTMAWVFDYYVYGIRDWRHTYKWHYPPLMHSLLEYFNNAYNPKVLAPFPLNKPVLPFVQLLSVLPPQSSNLLPKKLRKLVLSQESKLVKEGYYPEEVEVDYEGKTKEHMKVILTPFVDIDLVEKEYEKLGWGSDRTKNKLGKNEMFIYDEKYVCDHVSNYGTIKRCHVKKTFI